TWSLLGAGQCARVRRRRSPRTPRPAPPAPAGRRPPAAAHPPGPPPGPPPRAATTAPPRVPARPPPRARPPSRRPPRRARTPPTFQVGNPPAGSINFRDPMVPRGGTTHDRGTKSLFGTNLAGCPNSNNNTNPTNAQCAQTELNAALDVIFNHPNVGPFIGKQLI